jgi:hypothetical protein
VHDQWSSKPRRLAAPIQTIDVSPHDDIITTHRADSLGLEEERDALAHVKGEDVKLERRAALVEELLGHWLGRNKIKLLEEGGTGRLATP